MKKCNTCGVIQAPAMFCIDCGSADVEDVSDVLPFIEKNFKLKKRN